MTAVSGTELLPGRDRARRCGGAGGRRRPAAAAAAAAPAGRASASSSSAALRPGPRCPRRRSSRARPERAAPRARAGRPRRGPRPASRRLSTPREPREGQASACPLLSRPARRRARSRGARSRRGSSAPARPAGRTGRRFPSSRSACRERPGRRRRRRRSRRPPRRCRRRRTRVGRGRRRQLPSSPKRREHRRLRGRAVRSDAPERASCRPAAAGEEALRHHAPPAVAPRRRRGRSLAAVATAVAAAVAATHGVPPLRSVTAAQPGGRVGVEREAGRRPQPVARGGPASVSFFRWWLTVVATAPGRRSGRRRTRPPRHQQVEDLHPRRIAHALNRRASGAASPSESDGAARGGSRRAPAHADIDVYLYRQRS